MAKVFKSIILVIILMIALLVVLVFDFSPIVTPDSSEQVGNAETVQPLLNQVRTSFRQRYSGQTILVNENQANSLAGFLQRAKQQARANISFSDKKMLIQASYRVLDIGVNAYLNITVAVEEGKGVNVTQFRVGKLSLPGNWVLAQAEKLANGYTQSAVATKAIATVEKLDISPVGVNISLAPMDGLLREFKNIETGGSSKDTRLLKIRIAHYLRLLDQLHKPALKQGQRANSLAYYLHAVMKEAQVMSKQSSATLENEAAILAITIFAGSPRFATFMGDLSFAIERIPSARPKPVLLNRQDLSLHFIFSAAIKLLSEKGVSVAVGEFKELMDRGQGGSGYSFVDLAADLSGANFAALAVDPKMATHIQSVMVQDANEALFMVSIDGLEEGMSKQVFSQKYDKVDSKAYNLVVNTIEQRIQQLPIAANNKTLTATSP